MQSSIISHLIAIEKVLEQDLQAIRRILHRYQQPELPLEKKKADLSWAPRIAKDISAAKQFRQVIAQVLTTYGALYTQELIPRIEQYYKEHDLKLNYTRGYMRAFLSRERQNGNLVKDDLGRHQLPIDDVDAAEFLKNQEIAAEENEAIARQEIEDNSNE